MRSFGTRIQRAAQDFLTLPFVDRLVDLIKDVKSSNGTSINDKIPSPESLESEPYELKKLASTLSAKTIIQSPTTKWQPPSYANKKPSSPLAPIDQHQQHQPKKQQQQHAHHPHSAHGSCFPIFPVPTDIGGRSFQSNSNTSFSFAHGGNTNTARRLPMRTRGLAAICGMGSAHVRAPGEWAHFRSYS